MVAKSVFAIFVSFSNLSVCIVLMLPKSRAASEVWGGQVEGYLKNLSAHQIQIKGWAHARMRPIVWDRQQKKRLQHPGDRDRRHETRGGVVFSVHCLCVLCDGDCVTGSSVSLESGHQEMEECGQGPMTWHSAVTSSSSDTVTHTASILYLAADILLPSTRCAILMNIKCSIHDTVLAVQFLHRG